MLIGIIEADETYIGGKHRKKNKKEDLEPAKRGLGTDKTPLSGQLNAVAKSLQKSQINLAVCFTPLYVAERCYVYNYRNLECI